MIYEDQERHEKLIEFLSQFKIYQYEGRPTLKKVKEIRTFEKVTDIDTNDINKAVIVFNDILNIMSGSTGNINLYRLLQAYLTIPECRDEINKVVEDAHSAEHKKSKV